MSSMSSNSRSINEPNTTSEEHRLIIPSAPHTPSSQVPPLNLPRQDLIDGSIEEYLEFGVPLHKASMRGDWKAAKTILNKKKDLIKFSISRKNETALHVAVSKGHRAFVKNLVSLMKKEDLELQDNNSYTAFCLAVSNGDVKMAQILLKENEALINIPTNQGMMPLYIAASTGRRDMVEFLYDNPKSMQGHFWTRENQICFLMACMKADCFGSSRDSIVALEDVHGNNMLHLVGICPNGNSIERIPGAAYQMQQELVWFKAVESVIPPSLREKKNARGYTPREEFTNHHKHLVIEGEKWLKKTAAQLMVVAALLAGMSFAATITFAGGYNQETGDPTLEKAKNKKDILPMFLQYSSLAFFSSTASIINVLSLLTSPYAEQDFARLLPTRFMLSVATLLLSIVCMICAFSFNLTLVNDKHSKIPLYYTLYVAVFVQTVSFTQFLRVIMYLFNTSIRPPRKTQFGRFLPAHF